MAETHAITGTLAPGRPGVLQASTHKGVNRIIAQRIREAGPALDILEAGCGRAWPFSKGMHRITGVDSDKAALVMRQNQRGDLDRTIHGDLRTVELPAEAYDVVYCSFVLEHLDGAVPVLDKFVRTLKPGGRLILTFPDRDSVFGFFTRITPLWVHVLYKRYLEGMPNAGKPGHAPYPTYYDPITSRAAFHRYIRQKKLKLLDEYAFGYLPLAVEGFVRLVSALTFGRLGSHKNLCYVLQKT